MPSGVYKRTKEHNENMRKNHTKYWLGKTHSFKTRKKMSLSHIGKKLTEEQKRKIGDSQIGKIISFKTRKKISVARMGIKFSEETKRKMSMAQKGKHLSKKTKRKISENHSRHNLGGHHSMKTRLKMIKNHRGMTGQFFSEETKKRMSEIKILNPNKKFKETSIELKMEKELQKRGIVYKKQVPLGKVAITDFFLPQYNIIIQCDGCYYHGCSLHYPREYTGRKDKDMKQDEKLVSCGYTVYRFWEHEINESVENCINKIELITKND